MPKPEPAVPWPPGSRLCPRRLGRWVGVVAGLAAVLPACGDPAAPGGDRPPPNEPPVAAFTVSPDEGAAPLSVTFDASGSFDPDGEVVSYAWDFGDGSQGAGAVVTHEYETPGYFIPHLTVTDDRGGTGTAVGEGVIVTAPPGSGEGTIQGVVWHDRDGDGVRDPDDPPVAGMVVFLDLDGSGVRRPGEPFTVTDREGRYSFPGVETDRSYPVSQELTLGWTNTFAGAPEESGARPVPPTAGIIAGTEAGEGEVPFMVALYRVTPSGSFFTCGAVFVAARWVLTAAHCVVDLDDHRILPPEAFELLAGTRDRRSGGERVGVERVRVFPNFGADSFAGDDVALLELERGFMIPRIRLQPPSRPDLSAPGTPATAIGWGRTTRTGSVSDLLRKAGMPLISNNDCQRMLDEAIVESTICAGRFGTSESICNGDSGGPLMVRDGGEWIQVGVSSFARNCQPPTAFARVSAFTEWIEAEASAEASMSVVVEPSAGDSVRVDFGNFR